MILSRTIRSCRTTTHSDLATLKEPQLTTYYCWKHKKICKPLFSIREWFERYTMDTIYRLKVFAQLKTSSQYAVLPADARSVDILKEVTKRNKKFAEILKNAVHIKDKFFILNFSKESPFMEEASSLNIGHVASIIKPMFWENEKLFDFICKILKLNLSNQNRKFLIANLSASTSNYVAQLSLIRKMFLNPDQIKIDDLKKMITNENFDYFASASKFSKKDKFGFMKDLISGPLDFEELNNFFVFMIRHLMKLIDAEQLMEKLDGKKLNDYNKEIMICSKLWTKEEIRNAIRMFSLWQKMARAKDNKLIDSLRSEYLHQVT